MAESDDRYRKFFEMAMDALIVADAETGIITDANQAATALMGIPMEKLIGMHQSLLHPPEKAEEYIKLFHDHVQKEKALNEDLIIQRPDGTQIPVDISANTIDTGGKRLIRAAFRDITERKRMEQALKESEEKFSKAFKAIPDDVAITRVKDGVFIDANDGFCRHAGYTREEMIGHTAVELGLKEKPDNVEDIYKTIQEAGGILNREIVFNPQSDQIEASLFSARIIDIAGEPCMISVSSDITERKRMEKSVKESQERFSKAFNTIPEAIAITTLDHGIILEINDSFTTINGYSREEVIGHTAKELNIWAVPDDRSRLEQIIAKDASFKNEECIFRNKSGDLRTIMLSGVKIVFDGKPCMLTIGNDITERKITEQALRESEEKFYKAFQAIPESIAISRVKDGRFIDVNNVFCRFTGRTREEIIGRTGDELKLESRPDRRDNIIKRIQEHGNIVNQEVQINPGTEKMRATLFSADIIDIGGEPCIISISTDITERKRMEEALADETVRRRILIEQSSDGIVILDKEGKVYEANLRFAEMLGYTNTELLQLHIWDWEFKLTRAQVIKMINNINQQGDHFETQHRRKDGSIYDVEISTNGAEFTGQKLIFCVCRDITERKQAETKLKKAMKELELSSDQLKATNKELESFSYSVSHDLRSPLRSIDGFSQALLEDYGPKLDKTAFDYLTRMRNASQKMGELIDGLLVLSRLTRGEMHLEQVDLSALAQEISQRLQENEPERRVEFIIGKDLKANGDQQMLRSLMENLLGNAWKFTGKTPLARIEFGGVSADGKTTYFVKDNGAGFDMAYADNLFGAFQRLHSTADFPGTGIGLATTQRIVNRHGGTIRAESAVNQGATFYFTL